MDFAEILSLVSLAYIKSQYKLQKSSNGLALGEDLVFDVGVMVNDHSDEHEAFLLAQMEFKPTATAADADQLGDRFLLEPMCQGLELALIVEFLEGLGCRRKSDLDSFNSGRTGGWSREVCRREYTFVCSGHLGE